jgi:hypothetical protein
MTVDTGARITFNNIAVHGTQLSLATEESNKQLYSVFPNPADHVLNVVGLYSADVVNFRLFAIDGKQIKFGTVENSTIDLSDLSSGLYILELKSDGKTEIKKISKR